MLVHSYLKHRSQKRPSPRIPLTSLGRDNLVRSPLNLKALLGMHILIGKGINLLDFQAHQIRCRLIFQMNIREKCIFQLHLKNLDTNMHTLNKDILCTIPTLQDILDLWMIPVIITQITHHQRRMRHNFKPIQEPTLRQLHSMMDLRGSGNHRYQKIDSRDHNFVIDRFYAQTVRHYLWK